MYSVVVSQMIIIFTYHIIYYVFTYLFLDLFFELLGVFCFLLLCMILYLGYSCYTLVVTLPSYSFSCKGIFFKLYLYSCVFFFVNLEFYLFQQSYLHLLVFINIKLLNTTIPPQMHQYFFLVFKMSLLKTQRAIFKENVWV